MFREDYKQCNEYINPDPELIDNILKSGNRKVIMPRRRTTLEKIAAVAACLLIVFSSMFLAYQNALNKSFVTAVKDYGELYNLIQTMKKHDKVTDVIDNVNLMFENGLIVRKDKTQGGLNVSTDDAVLSSDQDTYTRDYSDTNVQVKGVQESDIVKTDGEYIYALSRNNIYIIKANGEDMEVMSKIHTAGDIKNAMPYTRELYITRNRLIVIKLQKYMSASSWLYYYETEVDIYDITDKVNPELINSLGQSGHILSSRMIGDTLYLMTNYYIVGEPTEDPHSFVPYLMNNNIDGDIMIKPEDICIAPSPTSYRYLVVTGIDTQNPHEHVSSKAVFSSGNNIYASLENLYVAAASTKTGKLSTEILKFSLKDGVVDVTATGNVPGRILNQFSMDEHKGFFRIVTTNDVNNLYVLDKDLNVVGSLEGLAKDESIYSVRFSGDVGYFVTFRQVDPLFAVNLEDPTKPKVLSELKIPGFSNYLYIYRDNLLFGLGKDADISGQVGTLKLSMFDVSDKTQVYEKHKMILGDEYRDTPALANHKAILISPERNIIGFFTMNDFLVFTYDEETGFIQLAALSLEGKAERSLVRGFYIDDYLYIYYTEGILVFSLDNFDKVGQILMDTAS